MCAILETMNYEGSQAPRVSKCSAEFNECDMSQLPFRVNELPQIRTTYDPAALQELAVSLDGGAEPPHLRQVNPIQVNEFDDASKLQAYLDEYRVFYNGDGHTVAIPDSSELERRPDGTWRILIAGHRRCRAMRIVADKYGYALRESDVRIDVYHNLPFADAVSLQGRENEHREVDPVEAANDIARHYYYFQRKHDGRVPTQKELVLLTGYSADRVSKALRYHSLPDELKDYYTSGQLPFNIVARLRSLYDAEYSYRTQKYSQQVAGHSDELSRDALHQTAGFANELAALRSKGFGADTLREKLSAKLKSLEVVQDELFMLEETPVEYRTRTRRRHVDVMVQQLGAEIDTPPETWSPALRQFIAKAAVRAAEIDQAVIQRAEDDARVAAGSTAQVMFA